MHGTATPRLDEVRTEVSRRAATDCSGEPIG